MYWNSDSDDEWRHPRKERTVRSENLPRAIAELEAEDPIEDKDLLDGPESEAHKAFNGTQSAPCIFLATGPPDFKWLPAKAKVNQPGVHLSFKVQGGLVAKQISITAKVAGSNVSKLHHSKLQFFLGQPGQVEKFSYSEKTFENSKNPFGCPLTVYMLRWDTSGAYGTGLEAAQDYDDEAIATFAHMESLTHEVLVKKTTVWLMVCRVPDLSSHLQAIRAEVIKYQKPWFPYLNATGNPACTWTTFPKRVDVKAGCGGLVPVPVQNAFTTTREACLILANGIRLEYRVSPKNDRGANWPKTQEDQTYLKKQILALNRLCGSQANACWWPVLLNQSVASLSIYDPLESMEATNSSIQGLWNIIQNDYPWDQHQREALRASRQLRGRLSIVEGGPGSGKTTTLAGITVAYACCGCPVLLFAPAVAQAKALTTAVKEMINRTQADPQVNGAELRTRKLNLVGLYPGEVNLHDIEKNPRDFTEKMRQADIVIALPSAICSTTINEFGVKSEKFLVIHDDAHQLTESEIWATIFSLLISGKCKGLIMSTDVKEWPLDVATLAPLEKKCVVTRHRHYQQGFQWMFNTYLSCKEEKRALPENFKTIGQCEFKYTGGVNEFAEQTSLALVSRLLRQGFPSVLLGAQHRLSKALATTPNQFVYKKNPLSFMPNSMEASDISRFDGVLHKWLGGGPTDVTQGKDLSVIFLEASSGKEACIKARHTTNSKRNHRNVDVVYDLMARNYREKAVNANDIKIVTQYRDQVRLYDLVFANRSEEAGGIPTEYLPQACTLDSFRGHEAKIIVYDLVVTCGDKEHGLGIVNNEFRACLATTRATDRLIIVGSKEIVTTFPTFWDWMNERTGAHDNPLPLIVRYAKSLRDSGLSFKPPTEPRPRCAFPVKEEWYNKENKFHAWEWNRNNASGERE